MSEIPENQKFQIMELLTKLLAKSAKDPEDYVHTFTSYAASALFMSLDTEMPRNDLLEGADALGETIAVKLKILIEGTKDGAI